MMTFSVIVVSSPASSFIRGVLHMRQWSPAGRTLFSPGLSFFFERPCSGRGEVVDRSSIPSHSEYPSHFVLFLLSSWRMAETKGEATYVAPCIFHPSFPVPSFLVLSNYINWKSDQGTNYNFPNGNSPWVSYMSLL